MRDAGAILWDTGAKEWDTGAVSSTLGLDCRSFQSLQEVCKNHLEEQMTLTRLFNGKRRS